MILDKRSEFFAGVAIPAAAGTSILGDVIDIKDVRDIGNGQPLYWYFAATETAVGGTSVQLNLVSSDAAAMTSPVVHASTGAVPLASLTPEKLAAMLTVPLEGTPYKRFVGIQAVVVGTFTAGKISSGFTLDAHGWKAYKEGQS